MKCILIMTTPPGTDRRVTEMVLNTIRVGFPTAEIDEVYPKPGPMFGDEHHHFSIIKDKLSENCLREDPLIFIDGDVIFWENMEPCVRWFAENYTHAQEQIAGFFVPSYISPQTQSLYMSRLHTSLLIVRNPRQLTTMIAGLHIGPSAMRSPLSVPYYQCDLIKPQYVYVLGRPLYFDTCAGLYHAFGGIAFGSDALKCYDHVNSASFYDDVVRSMPPEQKPMFRELHRLAAEEPEKLRGVWRSIRGFYEERACTLHKYLTS